MSVPVRPSDLKLDPVEVFRARAEARAMLWAAGKFDLHAAIDVLQRDAERDGLVAKLGQDEVQRLMVEAFAPVRDEVSRHSGANPRQRGGPTS